MASAPFGTPAPTATAPTATSSPASIWGAAVSAGPMTDDDLVRIIRTGIPNTPMPASPMTVEQAQKIVAYLRSVARTRAASVVTGDAARGRAAFQQACTACHRVGGAGSRVGPDLTDVGGRRNAVELERALLDPGADVAPANRTYRVVLKDGTAVTGRLLGHDTFTVQLLDTREQLRSFDKSDAARAGVRAVADAVVPRDTEPAGDRRHGQLSVVAARSVMRARPSTARRARARRAAPGAGHASTACCTATASRRTGCPIRARC